MEFITIIDCNGHEQNINVEFIYNISEVLPRTDKDKSHSIIHLNHKNDSYNFATFKTYEVKSNLLKRLGEYN